jgi:CoA:oxalate CoA-transferase
VTGTAGTKANERALSGLRVLDFSIMIAGPYCARLMADLGADVIKVEPPEGDDMRQRPPLRASSSGQQHSTYFGQLNAGKRSLALDLKRPEAVATIKAMVANTDVLLENFRPGVMERLGLGAATLRAINPRLVYASISGYGQTGANAQRPAYAMIVQAASGYERTLARYAGDRSRPAATATFAADLLGGTNAFAAIQTALVQRARTGLGQVVDVALMDTMLNLLVYEMQEAQFGGPVQRPTYGPVAAADGDLLVVPISVRNFEALAEVTALPALRSDPRFATLASRNKHWPAMMQILEQWTRERSVAECLQALEAAGVPCAHYAAPADNLKDAALQERGVFAPVADVAGPFTGINPPWHLSGTDSGLGPWVPSVGEHNEQVLQECLGLDEKALAALRACGAVASGPAETC